MASTLICLLISLTGLLHYCPLVATDHTTDFMRVTNRAFSTEGSTSFTTTNRLHCAASCSRNNATCDGFRYLPATRECHHLIIAIGIRRADFPVGQVTYGDTEPFYVPSVVIQSISLCAEGWVWMGYKCYYADFSVSRLSHGAAVVECATKVPGGSLMQISTPRLLNLIHQYVLSVKHMYSAIQLKYTWVSGSRVTPGSSVNQFIYDDGTAIPLDEWLWFGDEPKNSFGDEDVIDLLYKPDAPLTPNFGLNDEDASNIPLGNYVCEWDAS